MTAPVLVTGGTGTLGRLVVDRLRDAGRPVRVLSRHAGQPAAGVEYVAGDLTSGAGVDAAVAGVGTVVHCAGNNNGDVAMTRSLLLAGRRAGIEHVVYISVVGADRIPVRTAIDRAMFGYFAAKRAAERLLEQSDVPWTTLRATQFYDLVLTVVQAMAKLPVVPVPSGVRGQPVDAGDVADRLVELAGGRPAGLVADLAGPKTYDLSDMIREYLRTVHRRRLLLPVGIPGGAARAVRDGALTAPDRAVGRRTWEEFLADRLTAPGATSPAR
jgi:uncharacterized protein YbjT (DUF2867 family)